MLTLKLSGILLLLFLCQHGIDAFVICEGKSVELRCRPGMGIRVNYAIYGRSDRTTCSQGLPSSSTSDTNCRAQVTSIVSNRCNRRERCTVPASNSYFYDPCPGIHKYLDMTYTCVRYRLVN